MNWTAIRSIYAFEMARFFRTITQSLVSPVLSTSLYFVVFGAGLRTLEVFIDGTMGYLSAFPREAMTLYDGSGSVVEGAQRNWQERWTVFYWAWWIAFAPFVGVFLARVSRGRTVREFVLGSVLCPTMMCFAWFSATGGSALLLELEGGAGGELISTEHAMRVFRTIDMMVPEAVQTVLKSALTLLLVILVVACVTAATLAITLIGGAGDHFTEKSHHPVVWALVLACVTGSVIAVGGIDSIRSLMIVGTLPFSVVLALMVPSILRMIWLRKEGVLVDA